MLMGDASWDQKKRVLLRTSGFLIFAACDEIAQDMLQQSERSDRVSFEARDADA